MFRRGVKVLVDGWRAKSRRPFTWACAAVALVVSTAGAIPQSQGGGAQTSVVRSRSCTDCAEEPAMRRARELLRLKLDSLRWAIDHRQLNEAERRLAAKELMETISALEAAMEYSARARSVMVIEAETAQEASRAMAAVQSGRMRGYIGVTFDGLWARPPGATADNLIRFYEYPRIALVDASSPAERGGVLVGDTLVALNGDDVRQNEIAFGKLLIPDRRVTMRVRRDGSPRDLVVTVAEAPDFYERRVAPRPPVAVVPALPPSQVRVRSGTPGVRGAQPPVVLQWFGDALAGARLETVSGGLARALDVREGVLVIRTVPGTATYDSGLREGDIVTRIGDTRVRSVSDLQRALTSSDEREREQTLIIVRDRKERRLTLRW
jgi:C-terminal processing protease CtpA/Prc